MSQWVTCIETAAKEMGVAGLGGTAECRDPAPHSPMARRPDEVWPKSSMSSGSDPIMPKESSILPPTHPNKPGGKAKQLSKQNLLGRELCQGPTVKPGAPTESTCHLCTSAISVFGSCDREAHSLAVPTTALHPEATPFSCLTTWPVQRPRWGNTGKIPGGSLLSGQFPDGTYQDLPSWELLRKNDLGMCSWGLKTPPTVATDRQHQEIAGILGPTVVTSLELLWGLLPVWTEGSCRYLTGVFIGTLPVSCWYLKASASNLRGVLCNQWGGEAASANGSATTT